MAVYMKARKKETVASLQKRKEKLLETLHLPIDALPGSVSVSRYRCGKASCHCNDEKWHEKWTLTYMYQGAKRVKHIPASLLEYVQRNVEEGKRFKENVNEILGANAELLDSLNKNR